MLFDRLVRMVMLESGLRKQSEAPLAGAEHTTRVVARGLPTMSLESYHLRLSHAVLSGVKRPFLKVADQGP